MSDIAIYVGEAVTILCSATDPTTNEAITTQTGSVQFYAPPKRPDKVTTDRTVDEGPYTMSYDANVENKDGSTGAYVAYVDTTGWAPGKWYYRTMLQGAYESWEFGSFTLLA